MKLAVVLSLLSVKAAVQPIVIRSPLVTRFAPPLPKITHTHLALAGKAW